MLRSEVRHRLEVVTPSLTHTRLPGPDPVVDSRFDDDRRLADCEAESSHGLFPRRAPGLHLQLAVIDSDTSFVDCMEAQPVEQTSIAIDKHSGVRPCEPHEMFGPLEID